MFADVDFFFMDARLCVHARVVVGQKKIMMQGLICGSGNNI